MKRGGVLNGKAVIFYFSGTGNTWWAAEKLTKELKLKGISAQNKSIEQLSYKEANELIADCDSVGFGYPIYGSDLPEVMKGFMRGLSPAGGKDTFIFCTQWIFSGDGARAGSDFLRDKGFEVKWAEHFCMPNNISVALTSFLPYTNDPKKLKRGLTKAAARVSRYAGRIYSGKPFLRGFNLTARLLGEMQRAPFRRVFARLQDDIGLNQELCTYCGTCARLCPSGNLLFEGRSFSTKGICILCLRCYNFCPVSALTYRKRPHNLKRGRPYRGPVADFDPKRLRQ